MPRNVLHGQVLRKIEKLPQESGGGGGQLFIQFHIIFK